MLARPLLLGHRGARATSKLAENTIASFDMAIAHGCDGFEFDVRLTADHSAVLCHDATLGGLNISLTNRGELPQLACLEDVVRRYHRRVFLDIELKVEGLEEIVLQALRDYPPERGYVVSSFLPQVAAELRARSEGVQAGLICDKPSQLMDSRTLPIDYVIVQKSLVDLGLVQEIQSAGKKVLVWTVNEKQLMLQFARFGVDGIISDDTELVVRTLGKIDVGDDRHLM
jgi:glycerophosphoryl diester phosphodiesterase